jgi:hypothetical protein
VAPKCFINQASAGWTTYGTFSEESIMKREFIRLLMIICLFAAGSLNSVAQEKKPGPDEVKAPADGTFKILPPMAPKFAVGKVVKGAPYSATSITETVQTLSDGNQIIRKNESKLYRDSEGRTRTERTLETIGKWTVGGEARQHIFINDPVAGVSYSLDPRTHTAYKERYRATKKQAVLTPNGPNGTFMINGQTVTQAEFEAAVEKKMKAHEETERKEASNDPEVKTKLEILQKAKMDSGQRKTESLGTQTIEGVIAEGARATLTIPAGVIGNTLPLEIVDETWYSPELQIMVMTKRRDPRSGENTYRLTNLSRSEPDRSLFEVPADYTVAEGKMPPKLPLKPKPTKEEQ